VKVKLIASTKLEETIELTEEQLLPSYIARLSYGETNDFRVDNLIKLTRTLKDLNHTGPFECISYTFFIEGVSKTLLGQFTRHRIGMSFMAQSGRRTDLEDSSFYRPDIQYIKDDNKKNYANELYSLSEEIGQFIYSKLTRECDVKPQEARYILPASRNTKFYLTCNSQSLRHFFSLRLSSFAEGEINKLAKVLFDIVYKKHPLLYEDMKKLRGGDKDVD
jgi:thymidylate synthase (FAD)